MFDAYVDAEWAAQSERREGGLQHAIAVEVGRATLALLSLAIALAAACSLVVLVGAAIAVRQITRAPWVIVECLTWCFPCQDLLTGNQPGGAIVLPVIRQGSCPVRREVAR